jgi:VIT1/CCC1 family predicted Fe2+/Mn2+ transporter
MVTLIKNYFSGKIEKYLAEFVYGSIDGTVTTFAIIAGMADGFSMASSNYLSEQSHQDQNPGEHHQEPLKTALATFLSFITIGSIPVVSYIVAEYIPLFTNHAFLFAMICTGITFIGIGSVRGKISGAHPLRTSVETLVVGAIAAAVAYGVGAFLGNIL